MCFGIEVLDFIKNNHKSDAMLLDMISMIFGILS